MSSSGSVGPGGLIRQGDVLLVPVNGVPGGVRLGSRGGVVLAEGEATGHAHVIADRRARLARPTDRPPGSPRVEVSYLVVDGPGPVELTHEEHDLLLVPPGVYEVRRQREYVPRRRPRRVAD